MSSHGPGVQCPSPFENKRLNLIPVGRQLQRTPPTKTSSTHSAHLSGEPVIKDEEDSQAVTQYGIPGGQDDTTCPSEKEERKSYRRSSLTPASAKMENADPDAFIYGMQGYQWTDADLEFVYQAKQKKRAQQLQQELSEVKKTLQAETQRLELAIASRDQQQSELSKTPSCDSLLQLCKSILSRSRTSDELDGLDNKTLLSLLNLQDVQKAVREENTEIGRLKREEAKAQELRDKEERDMKDIDDCQKKISTLQANVGALKVQLAELKTRLSEKEEASKAAQVQKEVRKAAKARAISDSPKTPEGKDAEEMNTSQASVVSQVPENGRKGSRRAKPSTKVLKETAPKEKAGKDTAEESKTAPKKKAPKKMTSKKTVKREVSPPEGSPNEMPSQAKTPVEMENVPQNVKFLNRAEVFETSLEETASKFSNVAQVLEKGRKGSRTAKTSTTVPKNTAQKKTALKDLIVMEMADKEMAEKVKPAPKTKALKRTAKKELALVETDLQVKTLKQTALEETVLEETAPNVKFSDMTEVLKKGRKESRTANTSTMTPKKKALKKMTLKELTENKMVPMEMAEKEMAENGTTTTKAPKKMNSKKTAKKELAPDETSSLVKTPEEMAPEEMATKVKASDVAQVLEKGRKGSRMAKPSTTLLKALKKTPRETVEGETSEVDEKGKRARKVKATKKMTSKKEMAPEETVSQVKTLDENVLEEMALNVPEEVSLEEMASNVPEEVSLEETAPKVKASKLKAPKRTALKKIVDPEMSPEMTVTGTMVTNKLSSKVRAVRNTTLKKTGLKETAVQGMAEEVNALKETFLKKDPKEASKKEIAVKNKVKKEADPETTSEKMPPGEEAISTKTTRTKTTSKMKAPKEMLEKETALKETGLRRKASKEKVPTQKAGKKESSNVTWGSTQQAVEPPKSPLESDPETMRRPKRTRVKNPSLSETMPEKTTRSRRR